VASTAAHVGAARPGEVLSITAPGRWAQSQQQQEKEGLHRTKSPLAGFL
jgi:hypothetical protein